jgi:purine nucleosidase
LNRVVLDVDTGIDDAQALLFALRSPKISIEGITTVCGNIDVDQASENTLKILDLAKVTDLQVARGASRPLTRLPHHVPLIHGSKGLGDTQLPEPTNQLIEQSALALLTNIVRTYPKQVTGNLPWTPYQYSERYPAKLSFCSRRAKAGHHGRVLPCHAFWLRKHDTSR